MRRTLFIRSAKRPLSKADGAHHSGSGVGGPGNVACWWRDCDREEAEHKKTEKRGVGVRGGSGNKSLIGCKSELKLEGGRKNKKTRTRRRNRNQTRDTVVVFCGRYGLTYSKRNFFFKYI